MKEVKKFSIKTKIELSKILERIETHFSDNRVIKLLDEYHSKSKAHVIGITGPPGVGKSSVINKLVYHLRKKKLSIGIIAIDPSSKKSGGAILGDRARFDIDPADNEIFVRSMAARDYLGGISELTFPSMIVMRSVFDILIIETVGVGQSEISIENVADTVVFCVQPGSGDTLQFIKSGIIEIPDVITVTKSDLSSIANATVTDLNSSKIYLTNDLDWDIEILSVSSHKDEGFEELIKTFDNRWIWLNEKKILNKKRFEQDIEWIKKSIINNFGFRGLVLANEKIKYVDQPFNCFNNIKNNFDLVFKS